MTDPRRPYDSPRLTRVPLLPEEAVLTVCKTGSGSVRTQLCNRNQGGCNNRAAGS